MFAAAVAQARSVAPGVRTAQQLLARNVRSTEAAATKLAERRGALSTRVDDVQRLALADNAEGQRLLTRLDALSLAAASTAIIGPGLTVTVTDPGAGPNLSDVSKQRVNGSQQIILDRDLQLVVNSLWASGAEAISVGGVRIGPNVTIRQAGGAILVDNNPTSSPYAILAVGPPNAMRDVFDHSPGLQRLRLLEVSYGVGVTVNVADGLSLPAGSIRDVKSAKPIGPHSAQQPSGRTERRRETEYDRYRGAGRSVSCWAWFFTPRCPKPSSPICRSRWSQRSTRCSVGCAPTWSGSSTRKSSWFLSCSTSWWPR